MHAGNGWAIMHGVCLIFASKRLCYVECHAKWFTYFSNAMELFLEIRIVELGWIQWHLPLNFFVYKPALQHWVWVPKTQSEIKWSALFFWCNYHWDQMLCWIWHRMKSYKNISVNFRSSSVNSSSMTLVPKKMQTWNIRDF